jgi:hypothetical protein
MDVPPSVNGAQPADDGLDTSTWFESVLPPAAAQPEARIELSSIENQPAPPPPVMPVIPPMSQVAAEVRQQPPVANGQPPAEGQPPA